MAVWDSAKESADPAYSHPWLAQAVFALDSLVLRQRDIIEYSSHPLCLFRVQIAPAQRQLTLRDGTRITAGQPVAELHFWNEHIPRVPRKGADINWARRMQQGIAVSLSELARYLASRPELRDVAAICGDFPGTEAQRQQVSYIMGYYGFETLDESEPVPLLDRLHRFGHNLLISIFVFACNAAALRFDTLWRVRVPIYLSRAALEHRFGKGEHRVLGAVNCS